MTGDPDGFTDGCGPGPPAGIDEGDGEGDASGEGDGVWPKTGNDKIKMLIKARAPISAILTLFLFALGD